MSTRLTDGSNESVRSLRKIMQVSTTEDKEKKDDAQ